MTHSPGATDSVQGRPRAFHLDTLSCVMEVVLFVLGLFVFYLILRKAVTHGILEADEHREARARATRLEE
jgi:hypothetical protein